METIRRITTGLLLVALLAIGSFGFAAQSDSVLPPQTAHAEVQTNSECVYAANRDCGWFTCSCSGPTTSLCEGSNQCDQKKIEEQ